MKDIKIYVLIAAVIALAPMISFGQEYDIDTLSHLGISSADSPQFFVVNDSGSLVICMEGGFIHASDIILYNPVTGQERLAMGPTITPDKSDSMLNVTTGYSDIIKHIDGRIFASTCGDTVIVSSDGGNHWVMDDSGFIDGTLILDLASSPRGYLLAATSTGLYKQDFPNPWELLKAAGPFPYWVRVFAASNGNILVITSGAISSLATHFWIELLLSKDDGATWLTVGDRTTMTLPMILSAERPSPNVIKEDYQGRLYYPGDTLYISDDYGETWHSRKDYPRGFDYTSLMFTAENKILVLNPELTEIEETPGFVVARPITIYDAAIGGYRPLDHPFSNFEAIHPDGKIYALHLRFYGFPGAPDFTPISGILFTLKNYVVSSTEPLPEILSLSSSYPNPVSSGAAVTLTYTLERASAVTLRVQDVLGRTVHEEALGSLAPGEHTRTLPTSLLRPGMYFYTLLPGEGKPLVGKVVVAK